MRYMPCVILCFALCGCTQLPDIPVAQTVGDDDQKYPTFVPAGDIAITDNNADLTEQNVSARVASLRQRAARLKNVEFN